MDLDLSDVVTLLPNLIRSGSVGLVWPRLAERAEELGAIALALQRAYETQLEHNRVIEEEIARAIHRLRSVSIEPVLVKGWAISRLYPPPALRSAGDIDLWVPSVDVEKAKAVLFGPESELRNADVDLQDQRHLFSWLGESRVNLRSETEIAAAEGVEIRIPRVDDHLRMICLHYLGHGAMRPLWLCDIALLLEIRGADFNWERVLGHEQRQREWIITTLLLAHELLGARIADTPIAERAGTLPTWLVPAVLDRWERANQVPHHAIAHMIGGPGAFVDAMRVRWPDPITATVRTHARFNGFPRFPLQCGAWLVRATQFAIWRMPGQVASLGYGMLPSPPGKKRTIPDRPT